MPPPPGRYPLLAALLLIATAWFSVGHHQSDEHYQILEFAGYKLGLYGPEDLAWEFAAQMRPALQPALAYLTYRTVGLGGEANPFTVAFVLRLGSATLTLFVWLLVYRRYAPSLGGKYLRWFALGVFFHWIAYYNGVRFSSENWSGLAAVLGFLVYPLATDGRQQFTPAAIPEPEGKPGGRQLGRCLAAGVLFGLAFLFRYQVALLVGGFGAWMLVVERGDWRRSAAVVAGGLLTLAAAYPLTFWLYGEWTSPAWNYFAANLIEGKAATFGTRPWWGYLELVFLRGIPPLGLVYLVAFFGFAWYFRRDPVTWMTVAFVVVHSYLARKDIRFLYPLLPLVPVLVFGLLARWRGRGCGAFLGRRGGKLLAGLCWTLNFGLLATVLLRPAASELLPLRYVYDHYRGPTELAGPGFPVDRVTGAYARFFDRPEDYRLVESAEDCTGTVPCLTAFHTRTAPASAPGATLVYSNRPRWLEPLNFFGWADREKWWYVYELGRGSTPPDH